jgi:Arc/MetJ-type ribon-helix-helix transcriptional regulator
MNNEFDPKPKSPTEPIDDLMLPDDNSKTSYDRDRASSLRDIAARIPESLGAIGRDISKTIERAISAKDDYVIAIKLSPEAQEKLEELVQTGIFTSRSEAAAFLIDDGIKSQSALFERVEQKLAEIERLRAELRGIVGPKKA